MLTDFFASFQHANDTKVRTRIIAVYASIVGLNVIAWGAALALFRGSAETLSLCIVAYLFGLRHAVDADHIAAIDNVTRKLIQENKRPVCVGFFFSLGHSTVVILMCCVVALGTDIVNTHFPRFKEIGGTIGLAVSATFLLLIAIINFAIFLKVYKTYRAVRAGQDYSEAELDQTLNGRGLLARILRPVFRLVSKSWHMYPVGFLFGLGFDTTSEIALLGIAATQAAQQLPIWSILVFPLLFTAGMCLIDTTDGVIMLGAYGWAFVKPRRKLYYNMIITFISFVIALVVGGLEALKILTTKLELEGGIWDLTDLVDDYSDVIGYSIIGLLVACWLASMIFFRRKRLEESPTFT